MPPGLPAGWYMEVPPAILSTLTAALETLSLPRATRSAVRAADGGRAEGALFGLGKGGSITSHTASASSLLQALSGLVASTPAFGEFSWTSVQANHNTVASPHHDRDARGLALLIVLGDFTGGAFRLDGTTVDAKGKATLFDAALPHSSDPFSGDRWSLILFTHVEVVSASPECLDELQGWGFKLPADALEASPVPSEARIRAEAARRRARTAREPDSDTEPDADAAPAGAGWRGCGPPLICGSGFKTRPFQDGLGLCSPGRWGPTARRLPSGGAAAALRELIRAEMSAMADQQGHSPEWILARLMNGSATASPFPPDAVARVRPRLATHLETSGLRPALWEGDRAQPIQVRLLEAFATSVDDPAAHMLGQFAGGVRYGVGVRLPRLPAIWRRKRHWRLCEQRRPSALFVQDPEGLLYEGAIRRNYRSARDLEASVRKELEQMVRDGKSIKMSLRQAQARFGKRLTIASQGALIKQLHPDGSLPEVRVLFDGTQGVNLNPEVRQRDHIDLPGPPDLSRIMRQGGLDRRPAFGLAADVHGAHQLVAIHPLDWALQGCALGDPTKDPPEDVTVYIHTFGTYGISSIAYWWGGLAAAIGRCMYYTLGPKAWIWILL